MAMLDVNLDSPLKTISVMENMNVCRDRYGWFNVTFFHMWTCSQCYNYLFPDHQDAVAKYARRAIDMMTVEGTMIPHKTILYPDLFDGGLIKDSSLCELLGQDNCQRLTSCCTAAIECCGRQVENLNATRYHVLPDGPESCPKTWDGFACFQETKPGHTAQIACPVYINDHTESGIVRKLCAESGSWEKNPINGTEWTDYSTCVSLKGYRILYYVSITCNALSLLCLIPACIIFVTFKQLRKQHRIRIHLNLYMSFILASIARIGWDHFILRDRMENPKESAVMHKQTFQEVCKILYIVCRYSLTCNCLWMSLEGFHLYRLINYAFKAPKSIVNYYFIGWLLPLAPTCIYCAVRLVKYDTGCWVSDAKNVEWIMYGPILMCILINVAFLTNILRILLTQIQTHPNEPNNYRRALKATFILVPLFGLQLFLVIYRPNADVMGFFTYEVIAAVISDSQGAAVATVFCFLNSEVHGQFRSHIACIRAQYSCNDVRSLTFSSEMRRTSAKDTRLENIPLNCTNISHGAFNGNIEDRKSNSSVLSIKWKTSQVDDKSTRAQMV